MLCVISECHVTKKWIQRYGIGGCGGRGRETVWLPWEIYGNQHNVDGATPPPPPHLHPHALSYIKRDSRTRNENVCKFHEHGFFTRESRWQFTRCYGFIQEEQQDKRCKFKLLNSISRLRPLVYITDRLKFIHEAQLANQTVPLHLRCFLR